LKGPHEAADGEHTGTNYYQRKAGPVRCRPLRFSQSRPCIEEAISPHPEIRVFESAEALFEGAADEFATRAQEAVAARGRFSVALSGGSTPKALYRALAGSRFASLPWDKIFFFWGDERHVPPEHAESNYRMVNEALLSKVPVPAENIFRVPAEESNADAAAQQYEKVVRDFFRLSPGNFPRFDLVLLGLGSDGHTASLLPGQPVLEERQRWAAPVPS